MSMGESMSELLNKGGITLYILILCSIILLTAIIDRIIFFYTNKLDYNSFIKKITPHIESKKYDELLSECDKTPSILTNGVKTIILRHDWSKGEIENATEVALNEDMLKFDKRLSTIGTMAVVTPFIGLMGTVLGIIQAFADIASKGSAGAAAVSKGVSEALIATAAGLIVAIPASVFFNYFKTKAAFIKQNMRVMLSKIIEMVTRREQNLPIVKENIR